MGAFPLVGIILRVQFFSSQNYYFSLFYIYNFLRKGFQFSFDFWIIDDPSLVFV